LAALLAYDPEAPAEANLGYMSAAASEMIAGEVTVAVRDSTCDLGPITAGQHLGIGPGGITAVADSLDAAAIQLLDALVGPDHELVTILEGEGATAAATRRVTEWLAEHRPEVEVEVHQGNQPLYPYLFGVE